MVLLRQGQSPRQAGAKSAPRRPRCPKVIKMGSDFSGLDAAAAALKRMGVKYSSEFMCDNSKHSKNILSNVYAPKRFFDDIMDRDEEALPDVDLYIWTPPCQDVSPVGQRQGVDGPRNMGTLMKQSMKYIKKHRPRLTIFDNVTGPAHGEIPTHPTWHCG